MNGHYSQKTFQTKRPRKSQITRSYLLGDGDAAGAVEGAAAGAVS